MDFKREPCGFMEEMDIRLERISLVQGRPLGMEPNWLKAGPAVHGAKAMKASLELSSFTNRRTPLPKHSSMRSGPPQRPPDPSHLCLVTQKYTTVTS